MFKNSVVRIYLVLVTGHAIILPKALAENIVVEAESKNNLVLLYLVGRRVWSIFSMQHDNNRAIQHNHTAQYLVLNVFFSITSTQFLGSMVDMVRLFKPMWFWKQVSS
jgi:hypothetical protein